MVDDRSEDVALKRSWKERLFSPISVHRTMLTLIYSLGFLAAWKVFHFSDAKISVVTILATSSIFGTIGSAIMTMFGIWERDLTDRIKLNFEILHKDILHTEILWRRWPFLKRRSTYSLYTGAILRSELKNQPIVFNVGSHDESIDLPSIPADFYDLPVLTNAFKLIRFRRSFITKNSSAQFLAGTKEAQYAAFRELFRFECMRDIWISILWFRISRYMMHFGAALIVGGVVIGAWNVIRFEKALPPILKKKVDHMLLLNQKL